jgi:hypothetical protein
MLAHQMLAAAGQVWPPFVLVAGLLLIGTVAAADGLFEAIGTRLARAPLRPRALLVTLLGLVAVVTAVLNLDTSVVFLTPVLVHAARGRGLDERPFLYGSVFMSNSASLLLPGSNLTNLLVLGHDPISGAAFATRMLPAWLVACALTAAVLVLAYRLEDDEHDADRAPPLRLGLGAAATLAAATLVIALPNAALPVLALGLTATALRRLRPRLDLRALAPCSRSRSASAHSHAPGTAPRTCSHRAANGPPPRSQPSAPSSSTTCRPRCSSRRTRRRTSERSSSDSTSAPTSPSPARSQPSSGSKPPAPSTPTPHSRPTPNSAPSSSH